MSGVLRRRWVLSLALTSSLLASLLAPTQAQARPAFIQVEATQWGYTIAGPNTSELQKPRPKVAYVEAKSKFVVNYKNFPEWAKKDFQAAVDIWSANFVSKVDITIDASWTRLGSSGILGSARPGDYFSGFSGAPDASLFYPSALANALAGKDLDKTQSEMIIQVNSSGNWNTRNDGRSHINEYDLQSVFLHEMGHGLGFLSTDSYDSFLGYGALDQPTPFDAYLQVEDGRRLSDIPTPSAELGKALTSKLLWSGTLGIAANGGVKPVMYTPTTYEEGSSVSHLDEETFKDSSLDSVMTPNLDAGEIFYEPGPLLLAMMEDLRRKPPVGIAVGIPSAVRNPAALISNSSVIITFDPPTNARAAQITSYAVRNVKTNEIQSSSSSPILFNGLKNGVSYTFSITASNSNGTSEAVTTPSVTPQPAWKRTVIDSKSDGSEVVSTTLNGQPAIVHLDSKSGNLKLALWDSKKWISKSIDGTGGRSALPISGALSVCVSGISTKQILHIFYSDGVDKDLHYAKFDGKTFTYDLVDGNGAAVNLYEDPIRVRTASDVSLSSACIASTARVDVFYRDESQGILLGASKTSTAKEWEYQLVDGDRKTDGRTTGDVAFHISALSDGKNDYLLYDSVLPITQLTTNSNGEVRLATRSAASTSPWSYRNIENFAVSLNPVAGFDLALGKSAKSISASWLSSSPDSAQKLDSLHWVSLSPSGAIKKAVTNGFGHPSQYLSNDGSMIAFNCEQRLCAVDSSKTPSKSYFISTYKNPDGISSTWVLVNKVKYLVAGVNGQLSALRQ
jgi:hypothetical protein